MRNHGLRNRNESEFWGYNSRLDNIQAAIGRIKLPYIDKWNKRFIEIANVYSRELNQVAIVPKEDSNKISIYHRYIIQHSSRDRLKDYLNKNSIETKINYPVPLHLQPTAKELGYKKGDLPKVETQSKLILSLPIYAEITDQQIDHVIYTIKSFKQNS